MITHNVDRRAGVQLFATGETASTVNDRDGDWMRILGTAAAIAMALTVVAAAPAGAAEPP